MYEIYAMHAKNNNYFNTQGFLFQQDLAELNRKVVQLTNVMGIQQAEILHLTKQRDNLSKELGKHKTIVCLCYD